MTDIITVTQSSSTIEVNPSGALLELTQSTPVIEINEAAQVVTVNGEVSPTIEVASGRSGVNGGSTLYIQPDQPVGTPAEYAWFQTGLGDGTDITLWIEDGL